ncbi:MAG: hypothetical protein ACK4TA_01595 [Saprospiraceae bacterium]
MRVRFWTRYIAFLLGFGLPIGLLAQSEPTYYQDIAPILKQNCLDCHHVGGAAPFSLETYEDVERRADFIQMVTESRYMPPWFADPNFSHFRNEKFLSDLEIQTITNWVKSGKKRGKAPKLAQTVAKVSYPKPDLVIPMNQPFQMPGDGSEQFRIFVMPTHTEEELYVRGIEFRPQNLQRAHHARLMLDTTHLLRPDDGTMAGDTGTEFSRQNVKLADYFWYGWVPGNFLYLYPEGFAKRWPKGSDIVLNMHYSPTSKPETDQSEIRLYLTSEQPKRLVKTFILDESWVTNQPFMIPANQSVKFYMRSPLIPNDLSLISVLPHMHLLGKNFKAYAITPQGQIINIIKIDDWNFNWQMTYQFKQLIKLPKGSVVYAEAVYDNTSNNPRNPHFPPRDVKYGWGTVNEMMNLIFEYLDYQPGDETLDLYNNAGNK